jgi:hypothetical protein
MRTSLVALSVTGWAFVALAGCGGGDKDSHGYPAAAKRNFITACDSSSGGKKAYCQCALDKVQATMTYDEFKKEDAAIRGGAKPSRRVTDAMAVCNK